MRYLLVLSFILSTASLYSADPEYLELPESKAILTPPQGWTIKKLGEEISLYPPDQPPRGMPSRVHLTGCKDPAETLITTAEAEVDRITKGTPRGSNTIREYKGCTRIVTKSGLEGVRADFYQETPQGRHYTIVKYYFKDETGKIFKVCAHVYGGQERLEAIDEAIRSGLKISSE